MIDLSFDWVVSFYLLWEESYLNSYPKGSAITARVAGDSLELCSTSALGSRFQGALEFFYHQEKQRNMTILSSHRAKSSFDSQDMPLRGQSCYRSYAYVTHSKKKLQTRAVSSRDFYHKKLMPPRSQRTGNRRRGPIRHRILLKANVQKELFNILPSHNNLRDGHSGDKAVLIMKLRGRTSPRERLFHGDINSSHGLAMNAPC